MFLQPGYVVELAVDPVLDGAFHIVAGCGGAPGWRSSRSNMAMTPFFTLLNALLSSRLRDDATVRITSSSMSMFSISAASDTSTFLLRRYSTSFSVRRSRSTMP